MDRFAGASLAGPVFCDTRAEPGACRGDYKDRPATRSGARLHSRVTIEGRIIVLAFGACLSPFGTSKVAPRNAVPPLALHVAH